MICSEPGGIDDVYTYICLPTIKKFVPTCVTAENVRYRDAISVYEAVHLCTTKPAERSTAKLASGCTQENRKIHVYTWGQ